MERLDAVSLRVWCQMHDMEVRIYTAGGAFVADREGLRRTDPGPPRRATEAELQEALDRLPDSQEVLVTKLALQQPQTYTLAELTAAVRAKQAQLR